VPDVPRKGWLVRIAWSVFRRGVEEPRSAEAILRNSDVFDSQWYLHHYPDVARAGMEPAKHYLAHGWQEGRRPGPLFDEDWYLAQRPQAADTGQPPILHYLRVGGREGILPTSGLAIKPVWWAFRRSSKPLMKVGNGVYARLLATRAASERVTVVVPVFNVPAEVARCLKALASHLPASARALVIDDASTDPAIADLLARYEDRGGIEIIRHPVNRGYTATVNEGIRLAGEDDVVLLNSDTQVGPGWLTRLRYTAYADERTGSVTALSNNAGAFSAASQDAEAYCQSPDEFDGLARAVAQMGKSESLLVPTGSGFCLYLKRRCLNEVGLFDEAAFPRGYGEENDWCQRAELAGWRHTIDSTVYVFHARNASFGDEKQALLANAEQVIQARYPDYGQQVAQAFSAPELQAAQQRIADIAADRAVVNAVRPRVLYVISNRSGGTFATNQDLMRGVSGQLEPFLLSCDSQTMTLYWYGEGGELEVASRRLAEPVEAFPHRSDEYNEVLARWLVEWAIELVHVRHLAWHSLDLPAVAQSLLIPCVLSFHDYYTICPTVKLLDEQGRFCAGVCTTGSGPCQNELWPDGAFTDLKHNQVWAWQAMFADVLPAFSGFVTTSSEARSLMLARYPMLEEHPFEVIPHGRDFDQFLQLGHKPVDNQPLKVVVPGHLTFAKGGTIVAELAKRIPGHLVEFHILGSPLCQPSCPVGDFA